MSSSTDTDIDLSLTPAAVVEVKKFMDAENVSGEVGGLRVAVQPGGCSGFKYSLVIEDKSAEDDFVLDNDGFKVFVDPFSAQYISGVVHPRDSVAAATSSRACVRRATAAPSHPSAASSVP